MPKLLTPEERARRRAEKEAEKEAKLLSAEELRKRRAEIYGNTPGAKNVVAGLKTRRTAKTLAEGRRPKTTAPKTGKQISVRLANDVEEFALKHTPIAAYINELIRRDMLAQNNNTDENITEN